MVGLGLGPGFRVLVFRWFSTVFFAGLGCGGGVGFGVYGCRSNPTNKNCTTCCKRVVVESSRSLKNPNPKHLHGTRKSQT